jgi:hypothetical protein
MEWGSGIMKPHIHLYPLIRQFFLGGLLAALVVSLLLKPVAAAEFSADVPHPAVARIMSVETNAASFGSGTLVYKQGKHALLVTNHHVIRDSKEEILVSFPNGFRSSAKVVASDPTWDLAALLIWSPAMDAVAITKTAPEPGERLTIAGYGSGRYRAVSGICSQYVSPGLSQPAEMVELKAVARQGDSGGPIFNQEGELAGVLFGAGWRTTAGSYSGRVKKFLDPVVGRMQKSQIEKPTVKDTEAKPDPQPADPIEQPQATITGLQAEPMPVVTEPMRDALVADTPLEPNSVDEVTSTTPATTDPENSESSFPNDGEVTEVAVEESGEAEATLIDESFFENNARETSTMEESQDSTPIDVESPATPSVATEANAEVTTTNSMESDVSDSPDSSSDVVAEQVDSATETPQTEVETISESPTSDSQKVDLSPEGFESVDNIIGWQQLAGDTLLQQIRTVLAAIGFLAIVVQLARR